MLLVLHRTQNNKSVNNNHFRLATPTDHIIGIVCKILQKNSYFLNHTNTFIHHRRSK